IIEGVADTKADSAATTAQVEEVTKAPENKPKAAPKKEPAKQKPTSPAPTSTVLTSGGWITHKVAQGQTLFSIAKQYDAKVEDLIEWNGLSSSNLSLGQSLKVGKDKTTSVPTITSPVTTPRPEEKSPLPTSTPSNGG